MSIRHNVILVLAVLLVGGAIIFWTQSRLSNSGQASVTTMPTRTVQLSELTSAPLIYSDETLLAFDQATKRSTTFLQKSLSQQIVYFSPTGQYGVTLPSGKVRLIKLSTGATVREFSWEKDRILQGVSWSPNEQTVLLSSDRQQTDGGPIANTNRIDLWTAKTHDQIVTESHSENEQPYNLMSVSDDGSQVVFGRTSETGLQLFRGTSTANPVTIDQDGILKSESPATAFTMISAISNNRLLVTTPESLYVFNLISESWRKLGSAATANIQLSPITSDGLYALAIISNQQGADRVVRYSFKDEGVSIIMPVYSDEDGLYASHWLPGNRYLIYVTAEHEFKSIDTQDQTGTLLQVVVPVAGNTWTLVGFGS